MKNWIKTIPFVVLVSISSVNNALGEEIPSEA